MKALPRQERQGVATREHVCVPRGRSRDSSPRRAPCCARGRRVTRRCGTIHVNRRTSDKRAIAHVKRARTHNNRARIGIPAFARMLEEKFGLIACPCTDEWISLPNSGTLQFRTRRGQECPDPCRTALILAESFQEDFEIISCIFRILCAIPKRFRNARCETL